MPQIMLISFGNGQKIIIDNYRLPHIIDTFLDINEVKKGGFL